MYARIAVTAAITVGLPLLVPWAFVTFGLVGAEDYAARTGMGVAAVAGVLCGFVGGRIMARIVLAEWHKQERDALRKRMNGGHHEDRNS